MQDLNLKDKKILIIDSNVFISKTLLSILEAFEVGKSVVCHTIKDGEKNMAEIKFDCVFIDFMLEDKAGFKFITYIRKNSIGKNEQNIPIILNTGVTDYDTIVGARDVGVTEIISKPFSPEQILLKLKNSLINERTFINVDDYLGPNRRRHRPDTSKWDGENDRRSE